MHRFYDFLGRLLFPQQQDWRQRQHAKILVFTVTFALVLGFITAEMIRMMYDHKK
jgi:hypothetical protein